jgi:hypothetical protein
LPGRAQHSAVREAAHNFRQAIPQDGRWNRNNFSAAKEAHQQLIQHSASLKDTTSQARNEAAQAKDKSAANVDDHKAAVAAHEANAQAHDDNCNQHAAAVDQHQDGTNAKAEQQAQHDDAKGAQQQAQSDHDEAKADCDQAETDHADNTDHADGCDQNDTSAGTLTDTITQIGDILGGIEGKLSDSDETEDNDTTSKLCDDAETVVKHVEDESKWHHKALDCDGPAPVPAPKPPAKPTPPTTPTPPAPVATE